MDKGKVVYLIMTDGPSRGGRVYSVKESKQESLVTLSKLGPDAYCIPWVVGSEEWDSTYVEMLKQRFDVQGPI